LTHEDPRIEDIDHVLNILDFKPILFFIPHGSSLLDVGCGKCTWLAFLRKHRPDVEAIGVDINPDYVRVCREKGFKAYVMDAMNLGFEPESFDIVTCFHTLEHLEDDRKALLDMVRIARERVILVLPRRPVRMEQIEEYMKHHYIPFYTPLALKRLLKGLKIIYLGEHYKPTGIAESWLVVIDAEDSRSS